RPALSLFLRDASTTPTYPLSLYDALPIFTGIVLLYALVPLFWLVVNASKTQSSLFSSFGLWFSGDFALFDNIARTLTYDGGIFRSEEHTSELQSRENLVCRLLLEKKKIHP